jgi:hypothetical protein
MGGLPVSLIPVSLIPVSLIPVSLIPVSLKIAMCFVAALWVVGAAAYCFDYPAELVGFTGLLGVGVAFAEWRAHSETAHRRKAAGESHD